MECTPGVCHVRVIPQESQACREKANFSRELGLSGGEKRGCHQISPDVQTGADRLLWRLKRVRGRHEGLTSTQLWRPLLEPREGYRQISDQGGEKKTFLPRNLMQGFWAAPGKWWFFNTKHKNDISVHGNTAISQRKMSCPWHITPEGNKAEGTYQVHWYYNCSFTPVKLQYRWETGKIEFWNWQNCISIWDDTFLHFYIFCVWPVYENYS